MHRLSQPHASHTCIPSRAQSDKTPLHYAAGEGHASIVTELLAAGADINAKDEVRVADQLCISSALPRYMT